MNTITGHVILLMGPTGSGKGSLVKHVQEHFSDLYFTVSCTTREQRPGEVDGVSYYFISPEEFDQRVAKGLFLEWAEFSGNKYGTLKSEIVERLENGQVVLNEIELQGIKQLLEIIPQEHRTLVYIEAGSWEALKARALARAPMSEEHLELRYQRYLEEVKMKPYADVVIRNEDGQLEEAKKQMETLVQKIFEHVS